MQISTRTNFLRLSFWFRKARILQALLTQTDHENTFLLVSTLCLSYLSPDFVRSHLTHIPSRHGRTSYPSCLTIQARIQFSRSLCFSVNLLPSLLGTAKNSPELVRACGGGAIEIRSKKNLTISEYSVTWLQSPSILFIERSRNTSHFFSKNNRDHLNNNKDR